MMAMANDSLRFWPPLNFLLKMFRSSDRPTSARHFVTFSFTHKQQNTQTDIKGRKISISTSNMALTRIKLDLLNHCYFYSTIPSGKPRTFFITVFLGWVLQKLLSFVSAATCHWYTMLHIKTHRLVNRHKKQSLQQYTWLMISSISFTSHVAVTQQFYRRQAMEQGKIRPSVTLYFLDWSLPNLVWLIKSAYLLGCQL